MKNLVLKDGTTYQVTNDSNVANFNIPIQTYAEVDAIIPKMTKDNLSVVTVGGIEFHDVINVSCAVYTKDDEVLACFSNREGTDDIVQNAIDNYTLRLIEDEVIA